MELMRNMVITSSVLILAVLLFRRLFRGRISQRLWYAVWLLVAAKLLTAPFTAGIASPFSVMNLFAPEKMQTSSDVMKNDIETMWADSGEIYLDLNDVEILLTETDNAAGWSNGVEDILRLVWYIGIGFFGAGIAAYNLIYYLSLRKRRILYDAEDGELTCYLVEGLSSPCFFGKSIYLPLYVVREKQMLSHVLAHEYAHYRQKDMLWGVIRCICVTIYWYHPLVWLAAYVSRQDGELACDETAIAALGEKERVAYGKSLLIMVREGQKMSDCIGFASAMSVNGRHLKERMMRITKKSNTRITTMIILALCMVLLAGCTFTDKAAETASEPGTETGNEVQDTETALLETQNAELNAKLIEQEQQIQDLETEILRLQKEATMAELLEGDYAETVGTETSGNTDGTVNESAVLMRETANVDANVVTLLAEGQAITVIEDLDEFYKISISSDSGTYEGYVKKEYIDLK